MTQTLNLGIVQMGAIHEDLDGTLDKADRLIRQAVEKGAELVVLPEFFSREYFCQWRDRAKYVVYAEDETGPTVTALRNWAIEHGVPIVAGVYEKEAPGIEHDSTYFVNERGEIAGRYHKTHPAAVYSLEKLYYRGGTEFPVVELAGWRIGAIICYDLLFPEAARCVGLNGAELIVAPFATLGDPLWPEFIQCRAFENGCYLAAVNKAGQEGDWNMTGGSTVADPRGKVVLVCADYVDDVQMITLDKAEIESARTEFPLLRDRQPHIYGRIVRE